MAASTLPRRRRALASILFLLLGGLGLAALAVPALASATCTDGNLDTPECNNSGDVKVHAANATGSPDNDPHVACPFFVEGFNMDATSGTLTIKSWPPTGGKSVVLTDDWTADSGKPAHHFVNGPYSLPSGHYKLFVSDTKHDKMKVFWVDCEGTTTTSTTSGTSDTTTGTTTQIPFFPSAAALTLGTVGALGGAFFILRRRL